MLVLAFALAVAAQPGAPPVAERARALAAAGRIEEAIAIVRDEVEREPTASGLALLAQLEVMADRVPQGAASLAKALALEPHRFGWRTTLGALYYRLGRLEEAERELSRVIAERPDDAVLAYYYRASTYKAQGRLEKAEADARRAAEGIPRPRPEELVAQLDVPAAANALYLLAEIRLLRGGDGEPLLRRVLATEPAHPGARYLLARTLLARGATEEGRRELALFDRARRAHEELVRGFQRETRGDLDGAAAAYEAALEAMPDHARALFFLGRLELGRGRVERADALFARLLALRPEARPLVLALRRAARGR